MEFDAIIDKIRDKVKISLLDEFISKKEKKHLVYTSFDGDYMNFLPDMLDFVVKSGCIPINPESALGYYVSTKTHNGKKVPVMKDCIKTELYCDEMWVFNPVSGHIPEGVLAEMIIWVQEKRKGINIIPFFNELIINTDIELSVFKNNDSFAMSAEEIISYIESCEKSHINEIKGKLFSDEVKKLPVSAYIVANFFNYKHIDWTREYCYQNNYCPVSPQNLFPYYMYPDCEDSYKREYLLDRLTLLEKTEHLMWFTNLKKFDAELDKIDVYSATELYYWITYRNVSDIFIVDWADASVPKYADSNQWALTTTEIMEVNEKMNQVVNNEYMLKRLFEYEESIKNDYNIFKGELLGEAERTLISTNMNAFILGLISDQSVKAELAWSLPYRLQERLGYFDLKRMLSELDISKLETIIKEKPSLHRYPSNMAKYLYSACELIESKYGGKAENIWNNNVSAKEIATRLEEFKGISHKKAALGCLLLVRDLGLEVPDKDNINIAYDVHIRRICLRAGFVKQDTLDDVTSAGKNIYQEFPGRLTSTFWAIGRDICRPTNPACLECPLEHFCEKNLELGGDINA